MNRLQIELDIDGIERMCDHATSGNVAHVVGICPHCGSKLELEKGDIWWHKDIDGCKSPCVTCAACGKGFDVEGWSNINKIL